jgi:hypothetical protein
MRSRRDAATAPPSAISADGLEPNARQRGLFKRLHQRIGRKGIQLVGVQPGERRGEDGFSHAMIAHQIGQNRGLADQFARLALLARQIAPNFGESCPRTRALRIRHDHALHQRGTPVRHGKINRLHQRGLREAGQFTPPLGKRLAQRVTLAPGLRHVGMSLTQSGGLLLGIGIKRGIAFDKLLENGIGAQSQRGIGPAHARTKRARVTPRFSRLLTQRGARLALALAQGIDIGDARVELVERDEAVGRLKTDQLLLRLAHLGLQILQVPRVRHFADSGFIGTQPVELLQEGRAQRRRARFCLRRGAATDLYFDQIGLVGQLDHRIGKAILILARAARGLSHRHIGHQQPLVILGRAQRRAGESGRGRGLRLTDAFHIHRTAHAGAGQDQCEAAGKARRCQRQIGPGQQPDGRQRRRNRGHITLVTPWPRQPVADRIPHAQQEAGLFDDLMQHLTAPYS